MKPVWHSVDGLAEPVAGTLRGALSDPQTTVWLGSYGGADLGFLLARDLPLLPQGAGARRGLIEYVYVVPAAREVGVGEALLDAALAWLRERGISLFDAKVLPGQRSAKNFFEGAGFAARSIVMHHADG